MEAHKGNITDCWNRIGVWGDRSCPELVKHLHCRNCPVYIKSATMMLDRPIPAATLRERTELTALRFPVIEEGTFSVLVFKVGSEWFALPAGICGEVSENLRCHTIPYHRNTSILGLVNVRGELVISVSLEHVLGIKSVAQDSLIKGQRLVIIQKHNMRFAFPTVEVSDVRSVKPSEIRPVPSTLANADAHYVTGIFGDNMENIGLLDDDLLFYSLGKGLA